MAESLASTHITHEPTPTPQSLFDISHLLEFSDARKSAIRDASHMHHNLYGIYITLSDVKDVLNSAKTMRSSQNLARRILKCLPYPNAWCVTAESLRAIEELWTGQDKYCMMDSGHERQVHC